MRNKLEEILSLLRKEYNQRLELIQDNCKDIENSPIDPQNVEYKLELDELNNELCRRNEGCKQLQDSIESYINEFLNFTFDNNKLLSYDECFQLTITGDLDYNVSNPFFYDDNFYLELLEYFIEKEDYEKCNILKKRRNKII